MSVRDVVAEKADRYLGWLTKACSIPSLAGRPDDLTEMAAWIEDRFAELGAATQRLAYESAPVAILAELGSGDRSVLVYDHYDVQPVDPIDLWASPPFEPQTRGGILYARGAADNKGDLVARLAALEVYRAVYGELPVTVKFIIEGEEETGSKSFEALVNRYGDRLSAGGCVWEGTGIDHAGRPELVFGAKGLAYIELTYRGLASDQHSSLAAIAPSPVWHLIDALATLRDPNGKVLIDGFYDDVRGPTEDDMKVLESYPFEEEAERERLGVSDFVGGDTGVDLVRRLFFEPTCNIAGIIAGFTEPGTSKTVLPKEAMAKIDLRLVPHQDPDDIVAKVRKHLSNNGFGDIHLTTYSMEHPVRSPADSLIGKAAVAAAREVFDQPAAISPMMIATGPMYPVAHTLGLPTVSPAGVCRPDSNIHAPNENVRVDDFLAIIEYTVAWLKAYAELEA